MAKRSLSGRDRRKHGAAPRTAATTALPFSWIATVLIVCAISAYANSFSNPFVYDDRLSIRDNPHIRQLWPLTEVLTAPRESPTAGRPVANLSMAINFALGGLSPWGYHLWNLAVHVCCALLLFAIVRRTLRLPSMPSQWRAAADWVAFAATLVWLVHPLQTEVIDYVTQRTESMMGFFYLLTLYAAMRSMTADSRAFGWSALSIISCALGMATKEPMATAPLMVWLYDAVFVSGSARRALRERRGLYIGLAATWTIVAALQIGGPRSNSAGFSAGVSPWTFLLNQAVMIATYLKLAFWPRPLIFDYGVPTNVSLADVWPSGVFVLVLLLATVIALWRRPRIGFLGAWFFVVLAPSSSIVPIVTEVGAERRMYLPLAAVVVLAVIAVRALFVTVAPRAGNVTSRRLAVGAIGALSLVMIVLVVRRNAEYRSELNIWQTVLDRRPHGRAHYSVAMELRALGRRDEAMQHFQQALVDSPEADYAVAFELASDQKHDEAIRHYREFVRRKPDDFMVPRAYHQIGRSLLALNRMDEAIAAFREVLRMVPRDADAHGGIADVYMQQQKYEEAIGEYREYVRLQPNSPEAHFNLGLALVARDREGEAVDEFARAVALRPDDAVMRETFGLALVSVRRLDDAVVQYKAALILEPGRVTTHNALGAVLIAQGKFAEAFNEFQRTLERDPTNAEAQARLESLRP